MRYFIYVIGVLISVVLLTQAQGLFSKVSSLVGENKTILMSVSALQKSLDSLNQLQTRQPQTLLDSYQTCLNNMRTIALANKATLSVKSDDVSAKQISNITLKTSPFSGVGEIDFEATVLNLSHRNQIAAVFDALTDLEKNTPIIIKQIFFEKDYIVLKVSVLGV